MFVLISRIRRVIGLILPIFSRAGDFARIGPAVRMFLHILLVAGILFGLWYLNKAADIPRFLPITNDLIRQYYLPLMFVLLYILSWLGWWAWKLMGGDEEDSSFPDIDEAWSNALYALEKGAVNLDDTPVFICVGKPASGGIGLFPPGAADIKVKPNPDRPGPFEVWASNDAVWVIATDCSISGAFASRLSGEGPAEPAFTAGPTAVDKGLQSIGLKSIGIADDQRSEIQAIMERAHREGRELTADEKARLRQLAGPTSARPAGRALLGADDANLAAARLRHLCRIVARSRRPLCPANGVLVIIPWAATETTELADEAALHVQRDLETTREGLQLHCPVFAIFTDLEQARGFREFRAGFPAENLKRRLGQRIPLAPNVATSDLPGLFELGANWLGRSVFPTWVFKMLKTDPEPGDRLSPADVERNNSNLHALLREIRIRYPRLARILGRGLGGVMTNDDPSYPPMFGGCYLAATGRNPDEQAFVPGVHQRLLESQMYVSWSPTVFEEEDRYRSRTLTGYLGLLFVIVALAGAGAYVYTKG